MKRILAVLLPGAVLGSVLLLYLVLSSSAYTGDGTLFADLVRQYGADTSTEYYRLLLHPHHLAYGPLSVAFVRALGDPGGLDAVEIVRLTHLSSLLGAAALLLFYLALYRATRSSGLALAFVLLLAFSRAFWFFAENVEVQTLMLAALLCFLLAAGSPRTGRVAAARLGAAHGLAILAHAALALLALPAFGALLRRLDGRGGARGRVAPVAIYAGCVLLVAGVPYLAALAWVGVDSPGGLLEYLRPRYASSSYLTMPWDGAARSAAALEGLVIGRPRAELPAGGAAGGVRTTLRLLVGLVLLAPLLLRPRGSPPERARPLARAAAWTLLSLTPLWLLWDAGNPEFLVLLLPPALALLALEYARRTGTMSGAARHALPAGIAAVALLLGAFHLAWIIRPETDPMNNPSWVRAQLIRQHTGPGDVMVLSGAGDYRADKFYVRYFARRRRLVLEWKILETGSAEAGARALRADMAQSWTRGARLFITSDVYDPAVLSDLERAHGFTASLLDRTLADLDRTPVATLPDGFTLFELTPS